MIEITFIYTTNLSNVKEYGKIKLRDFYNGFDYLDEYLNNRSKPIVLQTIQCGIRMTSQEPKEVPENINIAVIGLIHHHNDVGQYTNSQREIASILFSVYIYETCIYENREQSFIYNYIYKGLDVSNKVREIKRIPYDDFYFYDEETEENNGNNIPEQDILYISDTSSEVS